MARTILPKILLLLMTAIIGSGSLCFAQKGDAIINSTSTSYKDLAQAKKDYNIAKKSNNQVAMVKALRKSAQVYIYREVYALAENMLKEAENIALHNSKVQGDLQYIYCSLAYAAFNSYKYQDCISYADKSIALTKLDQILAYDYDMKAQSLFFLHKTENFASIRELFKQANKRGYVKAECTDVMHYILRKQFRQAHEACNHIPDEGERLRMLVHLYEYEGVPKQAIKHMKLLEDYNDRHIAELHKRDYAEISEAMAIAKKQTGIKQMELERQRIEIENQRLIEENSRNAELAAKQKATNEMLRHRNDSINEVNLQEMIATDSLRKAREIVAQLESEKIKEVEFYSMVVVAIFGTIILIILVVASRMAKKQEKELEEVNIMIEESNQKKSEFLNNTTHEIRTPLNSILGFSEILNDDSYILSDAEKDEYSGYIKENVRNLTTLIENMYTISELDRGTLQPELEDVDVVGLSKELFDQILEQCNASIQCVFISEIKGIKTLKTDPFFFKQIMRNLLSNAQKYTQQGAITLQISQPDSYHITFAVQDTGPGISKENSKKIFDRFEKLGSNIPGNGVGLNISIQLAEMLGGNIIIDTSVSKGARFVFTHPIDI
ncbi:MAG: hypothetical protein HUK08_04045 [Bacteroidaceae bacterium]|nr:hypothetical protein [Bacteroidaceae bacterium]